MTEWSSTRFRENSNEEWLERLTPEFPYQCSRVCLNRRNVFWHWHGAVELFYMESGALTYYTPQGRVFFPEGSGGLINSDVLHRTTPQSREQKTMQLLHLFDASLLADHPGGRIMRRYLLRARRCWRSPRRIPTMRKRSRSCARRSSFRRTSSAMN